MLLTDAGSPTPRAPTRPARSRRPVRTIMIIRVEGRVASWVPGASRRGRSSDWGSSTPGRRAFWPSTPAQSPIEGIQHPFRDPFFIRMPFVGVYEGPGDAVLGVDGVEPRFRPLCVTYTHCYALISIHVSFKYFSSYSRLMREGNRSPPQRIWPPPPPTAVSPLSPPFPVFQEARLSFSTSRSPVRTPCAPYLARSSTGYVSNPFSRTPLFTPPPPYPPCFMARGG